MTLEGHRLGAHCCSPGENTRARVRRLHPDAGGGGAAQEEEPGTAGPGWLGEGGGEGVRAAQVLGQGDRLNTGRVADVGSDSGVLRAPPSERLLSTILNTSDTPFH